MILASALAVLQVQSAVPGPCDIYAKGGTPCVAAHSMTRALFDSYAGPLYNLKKGSATKDIHAKEVGGIADAAAHDAFCGSSGACDVQRIYDQSPWQNHLSLEGPRQRGHNINPLRNIQDLPVNFTDPRSKTTLHGQPVYAAFFAGAPAGSDGHPFIGQGYSNRSARGTAVGDEPETLYAVMGNPGEAIPGRGNCCFDYGNAERWNTSGTRCTDGTMEAIYVGGGKLRVGADLENGIYGSADTDEGNHHSDGQQLQQGPPPPSIDYPYVTAMVKGDSGNHFAVKMGDAQKAGSLTTLHDGPRPSKSYTPMKKQGAIILGIGGDNSPWAGGIFYEGVMTKGYASNGVDAAVMGNIVAAGYGK